MTKMKMWKTRELPSHVIVVEPKKDLPPSSSNAADDESIDEYEEEVEYEEEFEGDEEDANQSEYEEVEEEEVEEEIEGEEEDEEDEMMEIEEEEEVEEEEESDGEDDEEDLSNKESIRKLLEPFGKDQLIDIVKEAALKNSSLLSRITKQVDSDPIHRNIFVRGLSTDVTSEALSAIFSPFGKLEDCNVVINQATGQCKGYGFVLFCSRAAAQRALREPLKMIAGRAVTCQLAHLGHSTMAGQASVDINGRKIYVSNVVSSINSERLLAFFSKFGEIEQGPLGFDPVTGKFRGYALFIYKTVEGCSKALEEPNKLFEGYKLSCKRAIEGPSKINNTQLAPADAQVNGFSQPYAQPTAMIGRNFAAGQGAVIGLSRGGVGLLNPTAGLLNPTPGLLNPTAGLSPAMIRGGGGFLPKHYVDSGGISQQPYVIGSGLIAKAAIRTPGISVNSISPSVIGNYGTLAALQGLGAYQHSSSSSSMAPQPGVGSLGTSGFAPFYGK